MRREETTKDAGLQPELAMKRQRRRSLPLTFIISGNCAKGKAGQTIVKIQMFSAWI